MSEHTNSKPNPSALHSHSESLAAGDLAEVDCSGLARAIEMLNSGNLSGAPLVALLRHELARVQQQVESVVILLQKSSVELRQLRDAAREDEVQEQDAQRQLQDHNDRFVANLINEHEVELATLRRERDAAIDRVRELSREMTRVGSSSSANLPRVSNTQSLRSTSGFTEVTELKARIDELLHERERSVRLLRQLAEQRDLAETRLQEILASIGTVDHESLLHASAGVRLVAGQSASADVTGRRLTRSTPTSSVASESQQNADPTPEVVQTRTPPSAALEATPKPSILEDPNEWDVAQAADTTDARITAMLANGQLDVRARDRIAPAMEGPGASQTGAHANRVGTYSMRAEDLASEAVFVLPAAKRRPRNP